MEAKKTKTKEESFSADDEPHNVFSRAWFNSSKTVLACQMQDDNKQTHTDKNDEDHDIMVSFICKSLLLPPVSDCLYIKQTCCNRVQYQFWSDYFFKFKAHSELLTHCFHFTLRAQSRYKSCLRRLLLGPRIGGTSLRHHPKKGKQIHNILTLTTVTHQRHRRMRNNLPTQMNYRPTAPP